MPPKGGRFNKKKEYKLPKLNLGILYLASIESIDGIIIRTDIFNHISKKPIVSDVDCLLERATLI